MCLDAEQLGALQSSGGKTLAEQLVLMIGTVGENATLRRAQCWKTSPGMHLSAYTHPPTAQLADFTMGRYGGIVAFSSDSDSESLPNIGQKICQHIVGMNPIKVGDEETDEKNKDTDEESCLIFQEYLSDPEMTVNDVLKAHQLKVHDFVRFECGEDLDILKEQVEQPLDTVQTCQ